MSRRVQNVELDISNDHVVLYSICLLLLTIQLAVSCGSYSGKNKPKMFGDFEAQRHWMEITFNLPINLWYVNDTNNDLNYWGLDYPPLTAYHSYIMGVINSKRLSLLTYTGKSHKLFMRISVLITFWIIYIPPIIAYIEFFSFYKPKNLYFMIAILYPGIISLDNGHFQYNHISLGIFLISFICLISRYFTLSSILFVLAFNYKQMELYHSLPIAVFLLSTAYYSFFQDLTINNFCHLFKLFVAVVLTFSVLWFPFFYHGVAFDVLKRIFPFYRGLFEDKVANFWCTFSVLIKFKSLFSIEYFTVVVLLVVLPSLLILFAQPTSVNFKISLFISSLAFFLFSFQVHEKSILIAAVWVISNNSF
ncbi:unnamed protein product [Dracunculus medinensis]|uniref:Alpha-1,3-glucosyltransferase n=1 Tax=Dracunculus medinensis TaxID=318479 RepID=A0A158Q4R6_DRAME|nr:unnamed protein product [Dracunculus medinensis]